MSGFSRRRLIQTVTGVVIGGVGARYVQQNGLVPPDAAGFFAPERTLNYAAHRQLFGLSKAREFHRDQISTKPFANGRPPKIEAYQSHLGAGFRDWRLEVGGLVGKPLSLSIADLRAMPAKSQITQLVCEEGWSYIAEWTGVLLSDVLTLAGAKAARYVIPECIQPAWKQSIDLVDAWHPQTLVAYAMNGQDVPPGHGGPLRLRVPRQLGYKSLKYLNRLTVADSLDGTLRKSPYAWYAGI